MTTYVCKHSRRIWVREVIGETPDGRVVFADHDELTLADDGHKRILVDLEAPPKSRVELGLLAGLARAKGAGALIL